MDSYVLAGFLFYFVLWLVAFVAMIQIYTFFELVGDIVKNNISMSHAAEFHLYLTPKWLYDTLPFGVLLAVLVTFGVLTKNNEVTAFKACGISVRRLGLPVILMSGVLSAAAFAADYSWIPQRQPDSGPYSQPDQGPPRADLAESGSQVGISR